MRISMDGKEIDVIAQKIHGKLWFHLNGETKVYEPASEKKTSSKIAAPTDRIEAPMPGKILRVGAKAGDAVKTGQILVVMEAMKMEYTLAASADIEVSEVSCKTGEQVRLGQILMRFKERAK